MSKAGFLIGLLLSACYQLPDPEAEKERCTAICDHLQTCPNLEDDSACVDRCLASHYPEACAEAVEATSCSVLEQGATIGTPWVEACYPKCARDGVACYGNRITTCDIGHHSQLDCTFQCKEAGEVFSGVCGKTRNGQSSPSGQAQCWCDPK